jgi:dTDP-4-dehydrorhamnose reductase
MKVLVTGASGLVGSRVLGELKKSKGFRAEGTYLSKPAGNLLKLDITNERETDRLIMQLKPGVIIHTAALTNVDYCEEHPQEAFAINVGGTRNVVNAAKAIGSKVIFMSTDFVFNGKNGPYTEEDATGSINYYGKTKLEGERLASQIGHVIVRTTVVYGWEQGSKNFLMQEIEKLTSGEEMKVATDQYGSPTLADNLAEAMVELIKEKKNGIYNIAGRDVLSRYEFAIRIARTFGLDEKLLKPVSTSSLKQKAVRPKKAGLRCDKALRELKTKLLSADEGLLRAKQQKEDERDRP